MSKPPRSALWNRANFAWYLWRRGNWLFDPRSLVAHFREVEIDRPIFLVGNQGDGLTLVSRMLRRHSQVVSLSGNHHYWAGADEMHRALLGRLPPSLVNGGYFLGRNPRHEILTPPRSWSYAADDLIDWYRKTADDFDQRTAKQLRAVIHESLYRHGRPTGGRFTDKSQIFSVKMGYIDALLKETRPHFVLITRDPYASCYRNAIGKANDMKRYAKKIDLETRFEVCLQHWINTMRCIEQDKDQVSAFKAMKFEDILTEPQERLRELCRFLDMPFDEEMVPSPNHSVPFGSRFPDRWYPMRPDVNQRYLAELPEKFERQIVDRAGDLAASYGYHPPSR